MSVLVLSEECDPTADAVIDSLQRLDTEVYRVDLGWFPTRLDLDAVLGVAGWNGALHAGNRVIKLERLTSVFYRRPTAFRFEPGLTGPELRHAAMEAKLGLGGCLWAIPGLLWVNHPGRQADMHKPVQLAAAKAAGLLVPRTLITNRPEAVERFVRESPGRVVIKPLGFASIHEDGARAALYTHVLTDDELTDLRGVETTAHMFQRYVQDKAYELRLTVVGQGRDAQFFPVAIHAGSPASTVDFRADYPSLAYTIAELPRDVELGVRAFMNKFGIALGHFDFSVDTDGRHWFLECNGAAGQYQFTEKATGLPITDAIADMLQKGTP
ncbi:glutathione synthase/ribosomal protein S6 modification enzyme (glutaminyl transferase) [Pseudonocardia sp. CNS-139]|nr:glutathione synthase/ribosomal protein S6 modification enzyme (glutaminyl transferase) [Pseudonocardia sp. CNS-139]